MLSLELSPVLEKQFRKVIQESYQGDLQAAISAFLQLHEKYGWKECDKQLKIKSYGLEEPFEIKNDNRKYGTKLNSYSE